MNVKIPSTSFLNRNYLQLHEGTTLEGAGFGEVVPFPPLTPALEAREEAGAEYGYGVGLNVNLDLRFPSIPKHEEGSGEGILVEDVGRPTG